MAAEDAVSLAAKAKPPPVEPLDKKKTEGGERGLVGVGGVDVPVPTVIDRMGSLVLAVKGGSYAIIGYEATPTPLVLTHSTLNTNTYSTISFHAPSRTSWNTLLSYTPPILSHPLTLLSLCPHITAPPHTPPHILPPSYPPPLIYYPPPPLSPLGVFDGYCSESGFAPRAGATQMLLDLGLRGGDALLASGPLAGGGGGGAGGGTGGAGGGVGYGNLISWSSFLMLYASLCGLTAPSLDVPKRPGITHTHTHRYKNIYTHTHIYIHIHTHTYT